MQTDRITGVRRSWLGRIVSELSATMAVIVSALPRGVLAVTLAAVPANAVARDFVRTPARGDRASWRLLTVRRAVRALENVPDARSLAKAASTFVRGEAVDAVAAPLAGGVVPGYPAVVVAVRSGDAAEFQDRDVARLGDLARSAVQEVSETADPAQDASRRMTPFRGPAVFDATGRLLFPETTGDIDPTLLRQMAEAAREVSAGEESSLTRWWAAASNGARMAFRVQRSGGTPHEAGGDGDTLVCFARTPTPLEFVSIDPADLDAEPETARLLPALRFMHENFARQPSLAEIARHVHLSPFHFHRRFSELVGITPKHFLLDCQIEAAQRELLLGQKTLSAIATDCGFSHQSHFTSRFKQAIGLTPAQWRRAAVG